MEKRIWADAAGELIASTIAAPPARAKLLAWDMGAVLSDNLGWRKPCGPGPWRRLETSSHTDDAP
jgi:hypothetical protein